MGIPGVFLTIYPNDSIAFYRLWIALGKATILAILTLQKVFPMVPVLFFFFLFFAVQHSWLGVPGWGYLEDKHSGSNLGE